MKKMILILMSTTQLLAMDKPKLLKEYFDACTNNKVGDLERILKSGIDVNTCNLHGETGLWLACCFDSYGSVEHLLSYSDIKVNVNSPTTSANRTPLHFVVSASNFYISAQKKKQLVVALLQRGAEINRESNKNETALDEAIRSSDAIDVLEELINAGGSLDHRSGDKTVIERAICFNHTAQVQELVRLRPSLSQEGLAFIDQKLAADKALSADEKAEYVEIKRILLEKNRIISI